MDQLLQQLAIIMVVAPLLGCLIAGLFGKRIGRSGAHWVTILGVATSFGIALYLGKLILLDRLPGIDTTIYTWAATSTIQFNVGFLLDPLSALMLIVVTFVSLLVHIYSIGYMHDDPGYQRFFSYISLFTFAMLMLVLANNFMQLFFGWEGVGLASYLLIGFWFKKESANAGSLKAFMVNRVGDFGFLLGIAIILATFGTLHYSEVFAHLNEVVASTITLFPGHPWSLLTVICILLFVGAMGKSAQMPLHVWLPESMEGPTPISALIHAATMVTAGIYMVSRMSPMYVLSPTALSVVLIIGATSAFFMGLLGIVQHDIKRVVAYSTLSQLGYMIAALGASAFAAGMFHLITHAFFKALLFLAAGSVIIAMHHEQDLRRMGNLRKYMPITYITFLLGSLALCGIPPFAGFYSKDAIIEAVQHATVPGAGYAYWCVLAGVFVTAFYTFRCFFLAFHTKERMDEETRSHLHETPIVVWGPLVILAIPSVIAGFIMVGPMLFQQPMGLLGHSVVMPGAEEGFVGAWGLVRNSVTSPVLWLAIAGIVSAWLSYCVMPTLPERAAKAFKPVYTVLLHKYGFDAFNHRVITRGAYQLGQFLYRVSDMRIIDGLINGTGKTVARLSALARRAQTGYVFHYALVMVSGLLVLIAWVLLK